tara:strand:+ start:13699 stop:14910 length:1212 start_codon:yes stop_codon:yes gene_type:complete
VKTLLIDDDPFSLKLLKQQLANLGFAEVITHEHAKDALVALEANTEPVELIFCDLQMPEMDGVEFVRHLARIHYAGGLVLVSGEDQRILRTVENLAKSHKLNVFGILNKPVAPGQLKSILADKLSHTIRPARPLPRLYGPDEVRQAITNRQLVNHYQPKVAIDSGRVTGVETLARWLHPQDGLVFPDQFIATAEEHGFIDDLTQAVLSDALYQARHWQEEGLMLHVAVNISMVNLASLEFPDLVVRAAAEAGVSLSNLVLEVTESRLTNDPLASLDNLSRLRLKGISLSIDDFGTGHSSLKQLRDIPFDELKIDQSFVHGACRDASLRAIFEASLGMAKKMGMKTVAEGVENQDDWHFLRATGCDLAQGYFIARPMPAEALVDWVAEWEGRFFDLKAVSSSGP